MRGVRVERNVWVSNDNKKSVIDKKDTTRYSLFSKPGGKSL